MHSKLKKLALITMPCVVSLALSACGGSSHHSSSSPSAEVLDWAQTTGTYDDASIVTEADLPAILEGCEVPQGALIVMGDVFEKYYSWIWNDDKGNILGEGAKWPGAEFTNDVLASCSESIHKYVAPEDKSMEGVSEYVAPKSKSMEGFSVIVNNGDNGKQTGDGNIFTQNRACLKIYDEQSSPGKYQSEFVSATECGVSVEGLPATFPIDVYIKNNGQRIFNDGTISIQELAGKEESGYTIVTLLIKGAGITAETTGKYWFGDNEDSAKVFRNGEKIKIGDKVKVNDGETQTTELHVSYGEGDDTVTSSYKVEKSFSSKDDSCRLNKQKQTLGATYSSESTTFRIWSPDSSDVKVTVDGKTYEMTKAAIPCYSEVYEVKVDGDLVGKTYQFTVDGKNVRDPYGRMVVGNGSNANVVMDLKKSDPDGDWVESPKLENREDSIVYEVHVRDFTIDDTSNVAPDKKGRYLGMVQPGTTYNGIKTGIDHLMELGVTHVQLQPIYDYATCSDVDSQNKTCYNWGYDPWNYNVPEDRYTSVWGTDNYDTKIKEVKTMINEMHKNGIRVIMDVVYNHTYNNGDAAFKNITGKYFAPKDMTGTGNTINAANNMVWMMIRDSLDYWVSEYHIDGFRFDLVGAFSMKDYSDWGEYLHKQHPDANLVIYGEPWAADNDAAEELVENPVRTGRMHMQSEGAHVGAFNNRIRNCLKGSSDDAKALGFIFDKVNNGWDGNGTDDNDKNLDSNKACVFTGMIAGVRHADATGTDKWSAQGFSDPEQTVSYITAHDNLALRDKIEAAGITGEEAKKLQVYAHSILMASQGISFIHGGEEFGRTKAAAGKDKHNTYNTTTGANDFKWDLKAGDWKKVNEAYAAYIKMRKDHPAFRMTKADQILKNVDLDKASTDSVVIINIDGHAVKDSWDKIKVVMNSTKVAAPVDNVEGWTKVADGYTVGEDVVQQNSSAAPQAMSIWITKADEADTTKQFESMYIQGSFTGWKGKEMTYSNGKWTSISRCDDAENLAFLITPNTQDLNENTKWGVGEGSTLAKGGDNVSVGACTGLFKITVDDQTMEWSSASVSQDDVENQKLFERMYVLGEFTGSWAASELEYDEGGTWKSKEEFTCGNSNKFKIMTDGTSWDYDIAWGQGTTTYGLSPTGGDVVLDCTPGNKFHLYVNDQSMTWWN